jgi:SAM-dependent methyltransferase
VKALRVIAIVSVVAVTALLLTQGRRLIDRSPHEGGYAMGLRGLLWNRMAELPRGPLVWLGAWGMAKMHVFDRAMAPELDLQPDDELLDVGCGPGGLLVDHAAQVRFVAGLDVSEIQVRMARRRLAERIAAGTAEIALGDAAALPWADGRFSMVSSINALKFMPDQEGALREVHRVLRPGGRAVLTVGEAGTAPAGSPES